MIFKNIDNKFDIFQSKFGSLKEIVSLFPSHQHSGVHFLFLFTNVVRNISEGMSIL